MRTTTLPSGTVVPVLGQGTWNMGEKLQHRRDEIAALCMGIELGMTLIDTAEMYGSGRSEELVGEAITGRRDKVFLVRTGRRRRMPVLRLLGVGLQRLRPTRTPKPIDDRP